LAAKLTGWRIDIRSESEVRAEAEPEPEPEPVAVEAEPAVAVVEEDQEAIRHDLVAEVEAESLAADEDELEDEDRALLGGKKKKDRRYGPPARARRGVPSGQGEARADPGRPGRDWQSRGGPSGKGTGAGSVPMPR